MRKNISKIIILIIILTGVVFVWKLKNSKEHNNYENIDKKIEDEVEEKVEEKVEKVKDEVEEKVEEKVEKVKDEVEEKVEEKVEKVKDEVGEKVEEKVEKVKDEVEEKVEEKVEKVKDEVEEKVEEKVDKAEDEVEEKIINKNDPNFEFSVSSLELDVLKSYKLPILIDFGADACIPCQMMHPTLEELNTELRGKAIVKFIDVWKYPEAANGFDFSLIPTQFFFDKDGNLYTSHTGILEKDEIISIFKEMGME